MFENFLDILKDSLPVDVYNALMERLPEVQKVSNCFFFFFYNQIQYTCNNYENYFFQRWEEEIADSVKRNEASTSAAAGEHR